MASFKSTPLCEACSRRNKSNVATQFCTGCDDALCTECTDVHNSLKAYTTHHVVNIDIAEDCAFKVVKLCTQHSEKVLEFYCSDHDCVCCRTCIVGNHRVCENLIPLEDAAKGVKSSIMYEETSQDLAHLHKTLDNILAERLQNIENINENKTAVKQDLENFKAEVLTKLKEIETQVLAAIESIHKTLILNANEKKESFCMEKLELERISKEFEFMTEHGSESQIFLLINLLRVRIAEKEKDFQQMIHNNKLSKLVYSKSDLLPYMQSLGNLTIVGVPSSIQFKTARLSRAQNKSEQKALEKFLFEEVIKIDVGKVKSTKITGICAIQNDQLILCNRLSKYLLIYKTDGTFITDIILADRPWQCAYKQEQNMAFVTLPDMQSVQPVNMNTKKPEMKFKCKGKCYGIANIEEGLAVGGDGEVYILNESGGILTCLRTLTVGLGYDYSVKLTIANRLICCKADNGEILCIKTDGTKLFSKQFGNLLTPLDVINDSKGNLYVLGLKSNLVRLSSEGDLLDIALTKDNALSTPYAVTFNNDKTRIFISNTGDGCLLVFNCIYDA